MPSLLDRMRRRDGRVAFVLGGGGNLGAVQVGMLRALVEHHIQPSLVVGCSVGAINGAAFCAEPTRVGVARLEELWRSLDGKDLWPSGLLPAAVQLARKGSSVMESDEALRRIIRRLLTVERFEHLEVPFQCVATAFDEAKEVWFSSGPLMEPILASSAIPAIYPPVRIDGVRYIDGAVVNDVPISRAVELGARRLYVLHVGSFDRPRPEPRRPLDLALQAYWIARRHRFHRDLATLPHGVEAIVLPTGAQPPVSYKDFTHTEELRANAYAATSAMLDGRAADERTALD
ncbi:MAG: patatin-like phospholipase family protein [Acidimicrobiales bacterium]